MIKDELIKPLEELVDNDLSLCGNKAKNLYILQKNGLSIPRSWIILNVYIEELLSNIMEGNGVPIDCFKEARDIVSSLSYSLDSKLKRAVSNFAISKRKYVIRSSNVLEDKKNSSFAGMFTTYINESYTYNIFKSIISIWVESFSERVYEACKLYGITHIHPCSILIQELVNTDVGGVIFDDGEKQYLNSYYGQVKSVVDGVNEPDQWLIKDGTILEKKVVEKKSALYPVFSRSNPSNGDKFDLMHMGQGYQGIVKSINSYEGIIEINLPNTLLEDATLSDIHVIKIQQNAIKAKNLLGIETFDIEWAIDDKGQFFFLQIREVSRKIQYFNLLNDTQGIPLVSGEAIGIVQYVFNEQDAINFKDGSIILADTINGAVIQAMVRAVGVLVVSKSMLSHSSIIAREFGIPCVGLSSKFDIELDSLYKIDGTEGVFKKLGKNMYDLIRDDRKQYDKQDAIFKYASFFDDLLVIPDEWLE
ncbi:PEP/pyruvate-binding domain-containing protein [Listeria booriae]|uniref:PEP/pyruvate-binding domain-containing protein n=1 Tax=Listeria booriae TaxID=1552123 RepID=UPI001627841C|nr:PEP/pyruvate-binding domain-containing protein [Listeria booriae]MBC1512033.1 hypothetical protein [Listeria booriae]MBC6150855.1 hypothetical protein [Listeria booriae]MBC6305079.1 hypothetical protein [Listeria booriae]